MKDSQESLVVQLVLALARYESMNEECTPAEIREAFPQELATELLNRLMRMLSGESPLEAFEVREVARGRPKELVRDFCIAVHWAELRFVKREKAVVARRILIERWGIKKTAIKTAIRRYKNQAHALEVYARFRNQISNFDSLISIADRFHEAGKPW